MLDQYKELNRLAQQGYQVEIYTSSTKLLRRVMTPEKIAIGNILGGYGLRIVDKNGKDGFAYSICFDRKLVSDAVEACRFSDADRANFLPSSDYVRRTSDRYMNFKIEDEAEKTADLFETLIEPSAANIICASLEARNSEFSVISTEGVNITESYSFFDLSLTASYGKGSQKTPPISTYRSSHGLISDLGGIRRDLERKVDFMKDSAKLSSTPEEVVFTPAAADSVISAFSLPLLSGASRFEGLTSLKEGQDLGNRVSLTDDPKVKESGRSIVFDDEGLPKRRTVLIEDGVVKDALYNTYWSSMASRSNTNSASRQSFSSPPGINTSNLIVSAEEESDVSEGSVVVDGLMGVHSGDPTTGKFSVVAVVAWDGRKGPKKGITGMMITGSFTDLIRGIKAMSRKKVTDNVTITGDLMVSGLSIS